MGCISEREDKGVWVPNDLYTERILYQPNTIGRLKNNRSRLLQSNDSRITFSDINNNEINKSKKNNLSGKKKTNYSNYSLRKKPEKSFSKIRSTSRKIKRSKPKIIVRNSTINLLFPENYQDYLRHKYSLVSPVKHNATAKKIDENNSIGSFPTATKCNTKENNITSYSKIDLPLPLTPKATSVKKITNFENNNHHPCKTHTDYYANQNHSNAKSRNEVVFLPSQNSFSLNPSINKNYTYIKPYQKATKINDRYTFNKRSHVDNNKKNDDITEFDDDKDDNTNNFNNIRDDASDSNNDDNNEDDDDNTEKEDNNNEDEVNEDNNIVNDDNEENNNVDDDINEINKNDINEYNNNEDDNIEDINNENNFIEADINEENYQEDDTNNEENIQEDNINEDNNNIKIPDININNSVPIFKPKVRKLDNVDNVEEQSKSYNPSINRYLNNNANFNLPIEDDKIKNMNKEILYDCNQLELKEFEDFDPELWRKFYPKKEEKFFNYDKGDVINSQYTYKNNDLNELELYVGEMNQEGQRNGFGKSFSKNRKRIGTWRKNEFTGWGREVRRGGEVYEGKFAYGQLTGKGTYKHNKDLYIGDFFGFIKQGKGELFTKYYHYKGQFKNDKIWGKGRIEINNNGILNGNIYRGEIIKGINEHGLIYEGKFIDGFNGGNGIIYYPDGTKANGKFINGNLVPLGQISN